MTIVHASRPGEASSAWGQHHEGHAGHEEQPGLSKERPSCVFVRFVKPWIQLAEPTRLVHRRCGAELRERGLQIGRNLEGTTSLDLVALHHVDEFAVLQQAD